MCGIAGIFAESLDASTVDEKMAAMIAAQRHRGPDDSGAYIDPSGTAALAHTRLSIIDLSDAAGQPMRSPDGRYTIVFNGEVYNYVELRQQLSDYPFHSQSDTEVVLAAYLRWGPDCLERLIGMFALLIWDQQEQRLFAARDRFGVKPLYYARHDRGQLVIASEIGTLPTVGIELSADPTTWATYLVHGVYEHSDRTFWQDVRSLPAGHWMSFHRGQLVCHRWYDLADRVGSATDTRSDDEVAEEYLSLLTESIELRFRSDVPVGVNLSGGLDSSVLLGLVQRLQGPESDVQAFTFVTGDDRYDESPWVRQMLAATRHRSIECLLTPEEVPALASSVQQHQLEPFGGMPTLAYAKLFQRARDQGVIVLLDGQGLDEQWAGYEYYRRVLDGHSAAQIGTVQATTSSPTRPHCLAAQFRTLAEPLNPERPFGDPLRDLQYRDIRYTKIPRALRFNDRVSMRASTELREPFLDHRLFELALRQPAERKIRGGTQKYLLRKIASELLPGEVVEAPKRPLQTPQREWLRGELYPWADAQIEAALTGFASSWFDPSQVRAQWDAYCRGESDNSFYIWQWISVGLCTASPAPSTATETKLEV